MKTKKQNQTKYCQANKENYKKTLQEYCKSFSEDEKIKKKRQLLIKKKEYRKNYYYKWKNLFNHLICLVEELGNVCLKG